MITEKACSKCKEIKPLEEYYKNGRGRRGECKPCGVVANREYFVINREKINAAQQEYYVKNRERVAAAHHEYRMNNRERRIAYAREYRMNNREKRAAAQIEYQKARRMTDPAFQMASLLRTRLHKALRGKCKKSARTEQLLGCTFAEAKAYIERQFKEGMGWDKPKSFQIDHILPCAFFDLTDPTHQRLCFCYLNLQPLTPQENQRKGDSLPPNHEAHLAKLQAFVDGRPL